MEEKGGWWREGGGERVVERGWGGDGGRVGERGGGRGRGGEREGGGRGEGGGEGGMTILIGMFNSNPMIPQYLNNNLT